MACQECGREGLCSTCCCVHRAHRGDMRFTTCPLCKHPVSATREG